MKSKNLILLLSISLIISLVSGDCKLTGCAPEERCMADGFCTSLSIQKYCSAKGFSFDQSLLQKDCSKENSQERKFLCIQCKGNYEYDKRIGGVINIIYKIGAGIAILFLVITGFKLLTSGDLAERQNAKKAILFIIIGLIILIMAASLVKFVYSV